MIEMAGYTRHFTEFSVLITSTNPNSPSESGSSDHNNNNEGNKDYGNYIAVCIFYSKIKREKEDKRREEKERRKRREEKGKFDKK